MTMAASTIVVAPRIISPFFQSRHRSTFPSSWLVLADRARRRPRFRNELHSSSSETQTSPSSSLHLCHPPLLLSPPTRRWMSGTSISTSSSSSSKGNSGIHANDEDERRHDHRHCVDMVRTRDYEGYCKCNIICHLDIIFWHVSYTFKSLSLLLASFLTFTSCFDCLTLAFFCNDVLIAIKKCVVC